MAFRQDLTSGPWVRSGGVNLYGLMDLGSSDERDLIDLENAPANFSFPFPGTPSHGPSRTSSIDSPKVIGVVPASLRRAGSVTKREAPIPKDVASSNEPTSPGPATLEEAFANLAALTPGGGLKAMAGTGKTPIGRQRSSLGRRGSDWFQPFAQLGSDATLLEDETLDELEMPGGAKPPARSRTLSSSLSGSAAGLLSPVKETCEPAGSPRPSAAEGALKTLHGDGESKLKPPSPSKAFFNSGKLVSSPGTTTCSPSTTPLNCGVVPMKLFADPCKEAQEDGSKREVAVAAKSGTLETFVSACSSFGSDSLSPETEKPPAFVPAASDAAEKVPKEEVVGPDSVSADALPVERGAPSWEERCVAAALPSEKHFSSAKAATANNPHAPPACLVDDNHFQLEKTHNPSHCGDAALSSPRIAQGGAPALHAERDSETETCMKEAAAEAGTLRASNHRLAKSLSAGKQAKDCKEVPREAVVCSWEARVAAAMASENPFGSSQASMMNSPVPKPEVCVPSPSVVVTRRMAKGVSVQPCGNRGKIQRGPTQDESQEEGTDMESIPKPSSKPCELGQVIGQASVDELLEAVPAGMCEWEARIAAAMASENPFGPSQASMMNSPAPGTTSSCLVSRSADPNATEATETVSPENVIVTRAKAKAKEEALKDEPTAKSEPSDVSGKQDSAPVGANTTQSSKTDGTAASPELVKPDWEARIAAALASENPFACSQTSMMNSPVKTAPAGVAIADPKPASSIPKPAASKTGKAPKKGVRAKTKNTARVAPPTTNTALGCTTTQSACANVGSGMTCDDSLRQCPAYAPQPDTHVAGTPVRSAPDAAMTEWESLIAAAMASDNPFGGEVRVQNSPFVKGVSADEQVEGARGLRKKRAEEKHAEDQHDMYPLGHQIPKGSARAK